MLTKNITAVMEYIVHGSKNQNGSNFKLTLERVCRNEGSGSSHRQPMRDQGL